jgi:hypothetical protein
MEEHMSATPSGARLSSIGSEEVDDPLLARLDAELASADEAPLRRTTRGLATRDDPDDPFDVEVPKPAAYDLRRLYKLSGAEVPPEHAAALGARVPLLICHGLTPFYKGGRRPSGVWGFGYSARLVGVDGDTVAFQPSSELIDVAKVEQEVTLGLDVSGSLSLAPDLGLGAALPGITLPSAKVHASTRQGVGLAITCRFSVVAVQAGPLAAGGVRWNIYRAKQSIEAFQPLFQTLRVPSGVKTLQFEVETWIRGSGYLFGLLGARHWHYPAQTFQVSLEGVSR